MARLGRPHGLAGFLGLYVDPSDLVHFRPGSQVTVGDLLLEVREVRRADKGWQVAFVGFDDRESAETIRSLDVYVVHPRDLEEGEFWPEDLIGLEVRPVGGVVTGLIHGPTQDRLVVEVGGAAFEVPFVADLVPVVDLESGYVEIVVIEGLVPDQLRT